MMFRRQSIESKTLVGHGYARRNNYLTIFYLANNSFNSRTNSSAVHWSERLVKPHISANKMLKVDERLHFEIELNLKSHY